MDPIRGTCWRIMTLVSDVWQSLVFVISFFNPFRSINCPTNHRIDGKVVVITGATQGIGKSAAIELSKRGAKVILACRNLDQAKKLAQEIQVLTGNEVCAVHLDLVSLSSVRKCADEIKSIVDRIDILINNAGMVGGSSKEVTEDGFELVMQVNHLGPFLFTRLLLPKVTKPGRIIFTGSSAHRTILHLDLDNMNCEKSEKSFARIYSETKLANLLICSYLASLLKTDGISVNSFCPGPVVTQLSYNIFAGYKLVYLAVPLLFPFLRTPDQGAQTLIYLSTDQSLDSVTGKYFMDCKPCKPGRLARDFNLAQQFYQWSENVLSDHLN